MIEITVAQTPEHIKGILELQAANSRAVLTEEELSQEGFVTVKHSEALLRQMIDFVPQVIALDNGLVTGYVLAMDKRMAPHIPELRGMFAVLDVLPYQEGVIADHPFIVCGQACVHKDYRGRALLDRMYFKMKELFSASQRFCITEIAVSNTRSQRVHERVGFNTIHRYQDDLEDWNIVQWKW
ncbi:MAG TPA: GNAT family N-acetyltransferase [Flavihumibacter sp.]|nr:GNAT family N-acetyltransferase [Flavihumibacter sp.]